VLPGVIAASDSMKELAQWVCQVAQSEATVLLLGETGTGKERIARAVHRLSSRASHAFVAVNCAAIPAELLESELFGYSKGSFTGAGRDTKGLFEQAEGGTLFLDEIGELQPAMQAKLTRALEEKAIRRLGEAQERSVNARLLAATHRDIEGMIAQERFREDLWYRLNVATVRIPPLRERTGDIALLATHFLRQQEPHKKLAFSDDALNALEHFTWPGNVRQLQAAVERASIMARGEHVEIGNLPPEVVKLSGSPLRVLTEMSWAEAQKQGRKELSRRYLRDVLARYQGDVNAASKHAGVERESMYRLMRRYDVH